MALTFRRWCLALLAGAVLLGVAYLPPRSIEEDRNLFRWSFLARDAGARSRLAVAAEQWARLSEREALTRSPAAGPGPELLFRTPVPAPAQQLADSQVRGLWQRVPRADSSVHLRVVAWYRGKELDVGTAQEQNQVLLPELTDGRTCLVLLPSLSWIPDETHAASQWRWVLRNRIGPSLAPCALRAAFGPPGPEVGRWLQRRGYDVAQSVDWAVGGNLREDYWWNDALRGLLPDAYGLAARVVGELPPAYRATADGLACIGGRAARCDRAVLAGSYPDSSAVRIPVADYFGIHRASLGFNQRRFISDLIRERGTSAFRTFWSSSKPVPEAFAEAYHQPLSEWTRGWMIRNSGPVDLGAGLRLSGVVSGLLLAGLLVGLAAWGARRREIG